MCVCVINTRQIRQLLKLSTQTNKQASECARPAIEMLYSVLVAVVAAAATYVCVVAYAVN